MSHKDNVVSELKGLAKEARWLDAGDALERFETTHGLLSSKCDQELIDDVRELAMRFRCARERCDRETGWEIGHSYLGTETSFRYDEDGTLWLKTVGNLQDIDLFYTVAVIREVELFGEWVPFMRGVSIVKQLDFSRLCTHFSIGVRGILVRDCVLRVSACNSVLTDAALYFEGDSPEDDSWRGAPLPPRHRGFAFDRMRIFSLTANIEFKGPTAQRCNIIAAVDLRLAVPRSVLDFFLKRLVGIFLILWRRQSRRIALDPDSKHRQAIKADPDFYQYFLYPKYLEFLKAREWPLPNDGPCTEK